MQTASKSFSCNSALQLNKKVKLLKKAIYYIRPLEAVIIKLFLFWATKNKILAFFKKIQACEPECGLWAIAGWQNRVRACKHTSSNAG